MTCSATAKIPSCTKLIHRLEAFKKMKKREDYYKKNVVDPVQINSRVKGNGEGIFNDISLDKETIDQLADGNIPADGMFKANTSDLSLPFNVKLDEDWKEKLLAASSNSLENIGDFLCKRLRVYTAISFVHTIILKKQTPGNQILPSKPRYGLTFCEGL